MYDLYQEKQTLTQAQIIDKIIADLKKQNFDEHFDYHAEKCSTSFKTDGYLEDVEVGQHFVHFNFEKTTLFEINQYENRQVYEDVGSNSCIYDVEVYTLAGKQYFLSEFEKKKITAVLLEKLDQFDLTETI